MCGILASFNSSKVDIDLFSVQLNAIIHRGPDSEGMWVNSTGCIAMGSRRLAIQDLSPNGHMPMHSNDTRYIIVFNGEIYNNKEIKEELIRDGYSFRSNSDTEVVLNAYIKWGEFFLSRILGMFSIVIFDQIKNQFFVARDRAGEKPLYFFKSSVGITFSSELKQLLLDGKLERKIDKLSLKEYFENGYLSNSKSLINGVEKLSPGSYLIYDCNTRNYNIQKYWILPKQVTNNFSKGDLLAEFDKIFSNAVKQQLISDVPLGVLLSGGVDSSLVTAYASEHISGKLKTFNITFDGFGKYDESVYARQIANYFDTEHYELNGNELSFGMLDEILNYLDEPIGDSSILPTYLVSKLTRQFVTVALGGDGGDELFGGYISYPTILNHHKTKGQVPLFLREYASEIANFLPIGFKGRNFLQGLKGDEYDCFVANRLFNSYDLVSLFNEPLKSEINSLNTNNLILDRTGDLLYDITAYDFNHYMVEDILNKVDRATMAHSLELRAPFLDPNVINFAFSILPSSLKVSGDSLKILPKELLKQKISEKFNVDRKQGFSIPLNDWISNKWYKEFLEEIEAFPSFLNKEVAKKMLINVRKGYSNSSRLFALIIFSKWVKKYQITI